MSYKLKNQREQKWAVLTEKLAISTV